MNYQTLENMVRNTMNDIIGWFENDPINGMVYVIGAIVVIGAIRGIYRSMTYCGYRSHIGRRVL
jgi:hypothetical protein